MIDIRKLKELVRLMVQHDLTEVDLRDSEEQVTLRRQGPGGVPQIVMPQHYAAAPIGQMPQHAYAGAPGSAMNASAAGSGGVAVAEGGDDDGDLARIESPMVGTFYTAPDPDSKPFVSPGSHVNADTTVCLIEAMKIFNEIKAETSGTIRKVLASNGQPIEFGQPLFLVDPD